MGLLKQKTILNRSIFGIQSGIDTSDADAVAGDIILNKTAYVKGLKVTGNIVDQAESGTVLTPSTVDQAIPAGRYDGTSGSGKVAGDADLVAGNIKSGVNLFGVAGEYPYKAGNVLLKDLTVNVSGTSTTYVKAKDYKIGLAGVYRIKHRVYSNNTQVYTRIYVNDVAVGTERLNTNGWVEYSEDITVNADSNIQIYIRRATTTDSYLLDYMQVYANANYENIVILD